MQLTAELAVSRPPSLAAYNDSQRYFHTPTLPISWEFKRVQLP